MRMGGYIVTRVSEVRCEGRFAMSRVFTSLASAKLNFFDVKISSLSLVLTLPLSTPMSQTS